MVLSTIVGGRRLSPGRVQGFAAGDTKPCLFWHHTHPSCLTVVAVYVSSCDVMGFEGLQSQVQLGRLDWAEGQTENTCAPVPEGEAHSTFGCARAS